MGGAVKKARHIDTVGSQQDLAATLLAQLDIDHHDFLFSKNLADRTAPHFAFFTVPDAFGLVTSSGRFIYDNKLGAVVTGDDKAHLLKSGKAYLQKLYDDIAQR